MSWSYKHILLIGATAGIGRALADRLVHEGIKVTAVGRRQSRLDEFVSEHGTHKASVVPFDIGDLDAIPKFAAEYVCHWHPTNVARGAARLKFLFI